MNWTLLKAYGVQVFIAADQLVNALIPPLDGLGLFAGVQHQLRYFDLIYRSRLLVKQPSTEELH